MGGLPSRSRDLPAGLDRGSSFGRKGTSGEEDHHDESNVAVFRLVKAK